MRSHSQFGTARAARQSGFFLWGGRWFPLHFFWWGEDSSSLHLQGRRDDCLLFTDGADKEFQGRRRGGGSHSGSFHQRGAKIPLRVSPPPIPFLANPLTTHLHLKVPFGFFLFQASLFPPSSRKGGKGGGATDAAASPHILSPADGRRRRQGRGGGEENFKKGRQKQKRRKQRRRREAGNFEVSKICQNLPEISSFPPPRPFSFLLCHFDERTDEGERERKSCSSLPLSLFCPHFRDSSSKSFFSPSIFPLPYPRIAREKC